jgi:hypothetical protein
MFWSGPEQFKEFQLMDKVNDNFESEDGFRAKLVRELSRSLARYIGLMLRSTKHKNGSGFLLRYQLDMFQRHDIKKMTSALSESQIRRLRMLFKRMTESCGEVQKAKNRSSARFQFQAFQQGLADALAYDFELVLSYEESKRRKWRAESLVEFVGYLIPRQHREFIVGDLKEEVAEYGRAGWSDVALKAFTFWHLLIVAIRLLPLSIRRALTGGMILAVARPLKLWMNLPKWFWKVWISG